jgi:hypothetical protein
MGRYQEMQGFERLGEFRRALRASREASAAGYDPFTPYVDDLRFAEGMLFGVALVLPFWMWLGYVIDHLAH